MKDFNIYDPEEQRFPNEANGAEEWLKWFEKGRWREHDTAGAFDELLSELRKKAWPPPACPRVFVSHRQADAALALRVAWLANSAKFEFWLDVLDPTLQALGGQPTPPVVIGSIIEIALLNSSHVIGLLTPSWRGSMWLPYEFGRVKERQYVSKTAASWLHPQLSSADDPEYTHLGPRHISEGDITDWLSTELKSWQTSYESCPGGSKNDWAGGDTTPLP
jgi:hypothetical protein